MIAENLGSVDDSQREQRDTYYLLNQQEEPLNDEGYFYSGHVWYRGEVEVPTAFEGRDVNLLLGGLIHEGWVWINGEYVGHRP